MISFPLKSSVGLVTHLQNSAVPVCGFPGILWNNFAARKGNRALSGVIVWILSKKGMDEFVGCEFKYVAIGKSLRM